MFGGLKEFQPGLMLDDVKDLVDREVQGSEGSGVLGFAVVMGESSLRVGAQCPHARFPELSA